ncbi:hypothetical protein B0J13DRAFT_531436 [Dactylonectria estremocensis]|uniref:Uncharacterized protein n=1 Tax=Dactylonectria estremocensis TaxID=1079267 RepID=A0A9P9DQA0_9HYPO|nr:hypothetical protein B0J13DRAFT_531436 [Dactylonectria estremocensis]
MLKRDRKEIMLTCLARAFPFSQTPKLLARWNRGQRQTTLVIVSFLSIVYPHELSPELFTRTLQSLKTTRPPASEPDQKKTTLTQYSSSFHSIRRSPPRESLRHFTENTQVIATLDGTVDLQSETTLEEGYACGIASLDTCLVVIPLTAPRKNSPTFQRDHLRHCSPEITG